MDLNFSQFFVFKLLVIFPYFKRGQLPSSRHSAVVIIAPDIKARPQRLRPEIQQRSNKNKKKHKNGRHTNSSASQDPSFCLNRQIIPMKFYIFCNKFVQGIELFRKKIPVCVAGNEHSLHSKHFFVLVKETAIIMISPNFVAIHRFSLVHSTDLFSTNLPLYFTRSL